MGIGSQTYQIHFEIRYLRPLSAKFFVAAKQKVLAHTRLGWVHELSFQINLGLPGFQTLGLSRTSCMKPFYATLFCYEALRNVLLTTKLKPKRRIQSSLQVGLTVPLTLLKGPKTLFYCTPSGKIGSGPANLSVISVVY